MLVFKAISVRMTTLFWAHFFVKICRTKSNKPLVFVQCSI